MGIMVSRYIFAGVGIRRYSLLEESMFTFTFSQVRIIPDCSRSKPHGTQEMCSTIARFWIWNCLFFYCCFHSDSYSHHPERWQHRQLLLPVHSEPTSGTSSSQIAEQRTSFLVSYLCANDDLRLYRIKVKSRVSTLSKRPKCYKGDTKKPTRSALCVLRSHLLPSAAILVIYQTAKPRLPANKSNSFNHVSTSMTKGVV